MTFDPAQPGSPLQFVLKRGNGDPNRFASVPSFAPSPSQLDEFTGIYNSYEIEPLYDIHLEMGDLVLHRLRNKPDTLHPPTLDLFAGSIGGIRFTRSSSGQRLGLPANEAVANSK